MCPGLPVAKVCSGRLLMLYERSCGCHRFNRTDISQNVHNIRSPYPGVALPAHPERPPEVIEVSEFTGSTSAMIQQHRHRRFFRRFFFFCVATSWSVVEFRKPSYAALTFFQRSWPEQGSSSLHLA